MPRSELADVEYQVIKLDRRDLKAVLFVIDGKESGYRAQRLRLTRTLRR